MRQEKTDRKQVLIINGSASADSSNARLISVICNLLKDKFIITVFNEIKSLPHFEPELSINNPPEQVIAFRSNIEKADGIIICTPEYIFSIPGSLKNAIEWCVATTVFSYKPLGLVTASASGSKGHEQLQLIMKTVMAKFTDATTLLIQGIKSKINKEGRITDSETENSLEQFTGAFTLLIENV